MDVLVLPLPTELVVTALVAVVIAGAAASGLA